MLIDPKVDVNAVDKLAPYGGLMGPGDSALQEYYERFESSSSACSFSRRLWFYERNVQNRSWLYVHDFKLSKPFSIGSH